MGYAIGVTTPATRTEQVYEVIRSELLNGGLRPGQKLKMVELTERFGVSQSVIREALTRLTEQGLLVATPQRGFRVRDLSIEMRPGRIVLHGQTNSYHVKQLAQHGLCNALPSTVRVENAIVVSK